MKNNPSYCHTGVGETIISGVSYTPKYISLHLQCHREFPHAQTLRCSLLLWTPSNTALLVGILVNLTSFSTGCSIYIFGLVKAQMLHLQLNQGDSRLVWSVWEDAEVRHCSDCGFRPLLISLWSRYHPCISKFRKAQRTESASFYFLTLPLLPRF